MRYIGLNIDGKSIKIPEIIDQILEENNLFWVIDSEIEDADLEIKNNTLIWNSGTFYSGFWKFGIFKGGVFYGVWENGILENGEFKGVWKSGINLSI